MNIYFLIVPKPNSQIRDQALWYLSIFLLKMDKRIEAKAYLQTIVDEKSWKYQEAKLLLESLE